MNQDYNKKTVYIYWKKLNDGIRVPATEASKAGKLLLETGLRELYGLEYDLQKVNHGPHGKPFFTTHPDIHYNISHSGCYVVCAISGTEIGIDIQEKRVIALDKLGHKIFSPEEYREFLKSEEKQDMFFRQWVRIESYLKWTGEGISRSLSDIRIDGWQQFIHFDKQYLCSICAQSPLSIIIKEK